VPGPWKNRKTHYIDNIRTDVYGEKPGAQAHRPVPGLRIHALRESGNQKYHGSCTGKKGKGKKEEEN